MYTLKRYETDIKITDYMEKYVDPKKFIKYCEACENFGKLWSCPNYSFDVYDYWRSFTDFHIIVEQINFDKDVYEKTYTLQELSQIYRLSLGKVKNDLCEELIDKEKRFAKAKALYPGSCTFCTECMRNKNEPCRFPEKMRYSIESLGGDVAGTTQDLLGIPLLWPEKDRLPEYFTLVCGILYINA